MTGRPQAESTHDGPAGVEQPRGRPPTQRRLVGGLIRAALDALNDPGDARIAAALGSLEAQDFGHSDHRQIVAGLKRLLNEGRLDAVVRAGLLARELVLQEEELGKLASGGIGLDALLPAAVAFGKRAVAKGRPARRTPAPGWRDGPYFMDPERGTFRGTEGDAKQLANFTAVITRKSVDDDGDPDAERASGEELQAIRYHLEIRQGKRDASLEVTAAEFPYMRWPARVALLDLSVSAGTAVKDQFREAIEVISGNHAREVAEGGDGRIPRSTRYVHTGWTKLDGCFTYLTAGGGIGASGRRGDVEVRLAPELKGYRLPVPPEGEDAVAAVRASIGLLGLAPRRLMVPLLGAVYRALLGPGDFTVHLYGSTGRFKTELAKLALAHFQDCQDSRDLKPIPWNSTDNAIEALLHQTKDSIAVLDDLLPAGLDESERRRQLSTAARVFRAQGNQGGRSRLRSDTSGRPPKDPRGLALSTGEELLRGLSGIARAWVVEQKEGDVTSAGLTTAQVAAPLYSRAVSGYIRWLAPQMAEMPERIRRERTELREAYPASHGRTSEIAAHLELGWKVWLEFAVECGAIDDDRFSEVRELVREALQEGCGDQIEEQGEADPVRMFQQALRSAIASGRNYLEGTGGQWPPDPGSWGYVKRPGSESEEWEPANRQGRLGWLCDNNLYLLPEPAYKAAAEQIPGGLGIGQAALNRRLREAGALASTGEGRHIPSRAPRELDQSRPRVLHFPLSFLVGPVGPVGPDQATEVDASSDGAPVAPPARSHFPGPSGTSGTGGLGGPGPTGPTSQPRSPTNPGDLSSAATSSNGATRKASGPTGPTSGGMVQHSPDEKNGSSALKEAGPDARTEMEALPISAFEADQL